VRGSEARDLTLSFLQTDYSVLSTSSSGFRVARPPHYSLISKFTSEVPSWGTSIFSTNRKLTFGLLFKSDLSKSSTMSHFILEGRETRERQVRNEERTHTGRRLKVGVFIGIVYSSIKG